MIDREFTKLNSSIQTASNSSELRRDEEGNIEATIALRLPDNLFMAKSGPRKIDSVTMQTSKMRLSLENTPIAEIPMDMTLTTQNLKATKCQLDVYPFCLLDNGQIKPESLDKTAFPYYKDHTIIFTFYQVSSSNVFYLDYTREIKVHSKYWDDLTDDPFYEMLTHTGILKEVTHILNLCAQSNHEPYKVEDDMLLVKNIGTLEQMLQDGLENAITYASTLMNTRINVYYSRAFDDPSAPYTPDKSHSYTIKGMPMAYYFCKWEFAPDDITITPAPNTVFNSLNHACKPDISLREQSLGIAYDSVAFKDRIPVVWNTPYIETFDHPEQMMIDQAGKDEWQQPPPKRLYREDPSVNESSSVYSYTINPSLSQGYVMNIIANEEMRRTFSFLPWIPCALPETKTYYKIPGTRTMKMTRTNVETDDMLTFVNSDITIQMQKYTGFTHTIYGVDQPCIRYEYKVTPAYYSIAESQPRIRTDQTVRMDLDSNTPHPDPIPGYPESSEVLIKIGVTDSITTYTGRSSTDVFDIEFVLPTDSQFPATDQTRNLTLFTEVPHNHVSGSIAETYRNIKYWYDSAKSEWVMGVPPQGQWNSSVSYYDRWIPPYEPDIKEERLYNAGTAEEYKKVQYYYILHSSDEPFATYGEAFIYYNPNASTEETRKSNIFDYFAYKVWNNGTIEYFAEDSITNEVFNSRDSYIITIPDPELIPNLDLNESNQFYILDGTTAEVDVGANEIIDNRRKFLRKVEDRQIGYRGCSARLDLVNVATCNFSSGKWYIRYGRMKDKIYKDNVSPELLPEHYFWSYKIRVAHDDPYMPTSTTDLSNDHVLAEGIDYSSWMRLGAVYRARENYEKSDILTPLEVIQQMEYTGGTPYDHQEEIESEILYDIPLSECGSHLDVLREDVRTFHDSDEITKTLNIIDYVYSLWFIIADTDNDGWFQVTPGRRRQFADIYTDEVGPSFENAIPETKLPASWFDRRETEQGGETDLLYFKIPIPPPSYMPPYIFRDASYYATGSLTTTIDVDVTQTRTTTIELYPEEGVPQYEGNKRLTFTWNNLPMVVMSPIQSIVLTLQGMDVNQEYQPINASDFSGSALTSSIPVIENFYSLAQSLRDLHDELVVVKDSYSDTATYTLATTSGQERSITLSAKYITKDGKLHQIYIPPKGVFSLQLTFGISYYYTS